MGLGCWPLVEQVGLTKGRCISSLSVVWSRNKARVLYFMPRSSLTLATMSFNSKPLPSSSVTILPIPAEAWLQRWDGVAASPGNLGWIGLTEEALEAKGDASLMTDDDGETISEKRRGKNRTRSPGVDSSVDRVQARVRTENRDSACRQLQERRLQWIRQRQGFET